MHLLSVSVVGVVVVVVVIVVHGLVHIAFFFVRMSHLFVLVDWLICVALEGLRKIDAFRRSL